MTVSSTQRRRIGAAVCTILLAAQLAACGGGGSGSPSSSAPPPVNNNPPTNPPTDPNTPTNPPTDPSTPTNPPTDPNTPTNPPTDPNGPPTTPTTPVTPKSKVTLTGTVTDAPIANAVVTATVGGETFTVTADANGNYTLPIEIDTTAVAEFVTLTARGVGAQEYVEFTSLAGSFQVLLNAAGSDETLSSSENFATQITNVSTATAVFLKQVNNGNPITSDAALQTLSGQINAQDVLDLAAAIKLVVDDPSNYSMPSGQTSILALASDATARQLFINDVVQQNPSAFAAAQLAIATDPALAQPVNLEGLEAITTALMSTDAGFTFNYTGRILHFDLNPNGTGFAQSETFDQPFTWTLNGSTIEVTYNQPVTTESFDTEYCPNDDAVRQVRAEYVNSGAKVTFLSNRAVTITSSSNVTYTDCSQLQPRVKTETVARTVLSELDLQPITTEELAGNVQTLYVYDAAQQKVTADIAELNPDGTGTTRLLGLTFTWAVDEESGRLVQVSFSDGSYAEYGSFRDVDDIVTDIYWEVRTPNDGPVYAGAGASVFADPENPVELTAEDVPGRYFQFGVGDEATGDARLQGFRLRFDADFLGAQENDSINEQDEVVLDNEVSRASNRFRWSVSDDSIYVHRTFDTSAHTQACEVGAPNCIIYDERRIVPLAAVPVGVNTTRIYWLEERRFDDLVVTNSTPTSRLVRFYDKPSEQAAQGFGFRKSRVAAPPTKQRVLLRGSQLR